MRHRSAILIFGALSGVATISACFPELGEYQASDGGTNTATSATGPGGGGGAGVGGGGGAPSCTVPMQRPLYTAVRFGTASGTETLDSLAVDSQGRVAFIGSFDGAFTLGDERMSVVSGGRGLFVAELGADLEVLWAKQIATIPIDNEGTAFVAFDGADHVVIAGSATVPVDLGTGEEALLGNRDGFVAKFDACGNTLAQKRYGASGVDMVVNDVAVDRSDGRTLLVGRYCKEIPLGGSCGTLESSDCLSHRGFFIELDASGECTSAAELGEQGEGFGVAPDLSDGAFIVGAFSGQLELGASPITSNNARDLFLAEVGSGPSDFAFSFGESNADDNDRLHVEAMPDTTALVSGELSLTPDGFPASAGARDVVVGIGASNGNFDGNTYGGASVDTGFAHVKSSGTLRLYGDFTGSATVGSSDSVASGISDGFITDLTDFEPGDVDQISGSGAEHIAGAGYDETGGVEVFGGWFSGTLTDVAPLLQSNDANDIDIFVVRRLAQGI